MNSSLCLHLFVSFLGSPSLQTDGLMTTTVPPPPPPKSKPYESSQRNSAEVGNNGAGVRAPHSREHSVGFLSFLLGGFPIVLSH